MSSITINLFFFFFVTPVVSFVVGGPGGGIGGDGNFLVVAVAENLAFLLFGDG